MREMDPGVPGWGEFANAAGAVVPGVLGRFLFHFNEARRGRRKAFGWLLLIELAIAVPMGFIGRGVAAWFGLTADPALACAIVVAYLGPHGIEAALVFAREKWGSRNAGGTP